MKSEATDTDLYAAWCGGYGEGLQTPPIPRRMSDAPRDGKTRILLCNPDQDDGEFIGVGVWGEWSDGTTGWCIDGGEFWADWAATAWWPLPEVVERHERT